MTTDQTYTDRTVLLQGRLGGGEYVVRTFTDTSRPQIVFAVIRRSPVSARGNYQVDTVYRTIKPGSRNYRDATRAAAKAEG